MMYLRYQIDIYFCGILVKLYNLISKIYTFNAYFCIGSTTHHAVYTNYQSLFTRYTIQKLTNVACLVIPRLKLLITPQYDIAVPSGEGVDLQCTVNSPESLIDVRDGNLIIRKNGSPLPGYSLNANNPQTILFHFN